MLADLVQTLQDEFIVATRLVPAFERFFHAARQLTGLLGEFTRASGITGANLISPAALDAVKLFGGSFQPFGQLHDQGVFGTYLIHERSDLLGSRLLGRRMGGV